MTEFGFTIADRDIILDDIRVRGVGRCISHKEPDLPLVTTQPTPERVSISISYTITQGYTGKVLYKHYTYIRTYIFSFSMSLCPTLTSLCIALLLSTCVCLFQTVQCFFEDKYHDTPIFIYKRLLAGQTVPGPAIIIDDNR